MKDKKSFAILLSLLVAGSACSEAVTVAGVPLTRNGAAVSVIVVEGSTDGEHRYAAEELRRYIAELGGANVPIVTPSAVEGIAGNTSLILVGGPDDNSIVRDMVESELVNFEGLGEEEFLLRGVSFGRHEVAVVGGNDEAATLYAAYDFLERLGAVFLLSKDVPPEVRPNLTFPYIDVRRTTPFPRRGILIPNIYISRGMMHLAEVKELLDQMPKLKLNYLQWSAFDLEPWISFGYRGEQKLVGDANGKETGYLAWRYQRGSHLAKDISIGREHFDDRARIAPAEFQNVETPAEAYRVAKHFLTEVIRHAKKRHIDVWLSVDPTTLPQNLARYGRRAENWTWRADFILGTPMCPGDPVLHEINEDRLRALAETYPEAEGYFLFLPELYPKCSHPDDKAVLAEERKHFAEIKPHIPTPEQWGAAIFTDPEATIDSIAGSAYIARKMIEARDRVAPGVRVGIGGIGHAYVLPALDPLFPEDVPFSDMESRGVWTPDGVPMHFFASTNNRERTIIPRGDDDGQMFGPQFNVTLYEKDRVIEGSLEHGLAGFALQINRIRGTEHNIQYLSEAAWEPDLKPDTFYERYTQRLVGREAADELLAAFKILEENEAYLGWRGRNSFQCCSPIPEVHLAYRLYNLRDPFNDPQGSEGWGDFVSRSPEQIQHFSKSAAQLRAALDLLRAASSQAPAASSRYELSYLQNKVESFALMFEALVAARKGYLAFDEAFKLWKEQKTSREAFVQSLDEAMEMFTRAKVLGVRTTEKFAELVDHPSDLGVLYNANLFLVTGLDLVHQTIRNVVEYHHGRHYTTQVPWRRIYWDFPRQER